MVTESEKKLDTALAEAVSSFDLLSYLHPKNYDKEKKRFFEERGSNPVFKYDPFPKDKAEKLLKKISGFEDVDGKFAPLLVARRDELFASIQLTASIGSTKFSSEAAKIFPLPGEKETLRARRILQKYHHYIGKKKKAKFLLAHEAKEAALEYLRKLGIDGVKVEIQGGRSVRVAVEKKSNTLYIASGSKFGPSSLRGVFAHEIGVHVVRGMNAKVQPLQLFEIGTKGYLATEEGLATIARKMVTENPFFVSTSYFVIASDIGSRTSFRETYNVLRKLGASEESAWKYTFRVKRGLSDTAKPGVFAKDAQYLLGVFGIERYLKEDGKLQNLFVGKVSPKDVKFLSGKSDIVPPKFFPEFFVDAESKVLELLSRNT
jgi:hypothetical protein